MGRHRIVVIGDVAVEAMPARMKGYDGTNWQDLLVQSATYKNLRVMLYTSGNALEAKSSIVDAVSGADIGLVGNARIMGYNGATYDRLRSNANKHLLTASSNATSFSVVSKVVTSAGTGEQFAALAVPDGFGVVVRAKPGNTGEIYLGDSKANAEANLFALTAVQTVTLRVTNTNKIWVDSSVDGEGVDYIVEDSIA